MTMRERAFGSFASSPENKMSRAPVDDVLGMAVLPPHAITLRASSNSAGTPSIRHMLRAIAGESGRRALNRVKELQPLVTQAHDRLRERFESGGSAEDYLRGRARLADSTVVGLLHLASLSSGIRGGSMVAPLAAIAVGGYGRKELAPGSDLDLLFLLPESNRLAPATKACISAVVASLWDLGFVLDHSARSTSECLELAKHEPTVLPGLVNRRFLWGCFGLFTSLDADITALLSGPDVARWRDRGWLCFVERSSPCGSRSASFGRRARRQAKPRWPARFAARRLGQHTRLRAPHVAGASVAHRGAPLPLARAVSSTFPRGSGRRPS
jgi:hypothetical protein